ncbi:Cytochrome p450 86a2, partial [Globisporangium polare]
EAKISVAVLLEKFHVKMQEGERVKDRPYRVGATLIMDGGPLV